MSQAALMYDVIPRYFTTGEQMASLQVTVTNPMPTVPVTLYQLGITLRTGASPEALIAVGDDTVHQSPGRDGCPAYAQVQYVINNLKELLSANGIKSAKALKEAIKLLQDALDRNNWANDFFLDDNGGKAFFDQTGQAVQALEEIVKDGEPEAAQDAIDNLVAISAHMAGNQNKIDEAHGEFAKAEAYRAGGKAGEAIEHYCKAWDGASKGTAPIAPDQQSLFKSIEAATPHTKTAARQYLFAACDEENGVPVTDKQLIFTLSNLAINGLAGTSIVTVSEWSGTDCPAGCAYPDIEVDKRPAGWVEPKIWAQDQESTDIEYMGSTKLCWTGTPGATFTLKFHDPQQQLSDPSNPKSICVTTTSEDGNGSYPTPGLVENPTVFNLFVEYTDPVTGQTYSPQKTWPLSLPVGAPPPVLPKIICFEGAVEAVNGRLQLTLNWETENADHVEISSQPASEVNGPQNANGPKLFTPPADQPLPNSIALKAVNKDGSVLSRLVLELQPLSNSADIPEGMTPVAVAASRDGEHVFVAAYAADVSENDALLVVKAGTLDSATDSPVPLGNRPKHIAVSTDHVFVTYLDDNKLTVLDAHTFIQKSSVPVRDGNQEYSLGVAMSPDEKSVYVLMRNWDENSVVPDENTVTLTVFDEPTLQRLPNSPIPLGEAAGLAVEAPIAVSTDLAFVAIASHKQLTVVDAYTCEKKTDPQAQIGEGVQSMVVSPDGKHVFAVNGDNALAVLDVEANRLSLLQPVSGAPVALITTAGGLAISSAGTRLFAANSSDNTLTVLDVDLDTGIYQRACRPVKLNGRGRPNGVALSPDGTHIYVTDGISLAAFSIAFVPEPAPVIVNFSSSPAGLVEPGTPVMISWSTLYADSCTIDNGIGKVEASGQISVAAPEPGETTSYTLTCSGQETVTGVAAVTTILAPIIKAFSAAPVYPGGRRLMGAPPATTYTLRWETEHADGCAIDPGVGSVEVSGEITVQATTKPTTYTLTCTGQKTVTASVTITIALPPY